jgi:hypothetical protein
VVHEPSQDVRCAENLGDRSYLGSRVFSRVGLSPERYMSDPGFADGPFVAATLEDLGNGIAAKSGEDRISIGQFSLCLEDQIVVYCLESFDWRTG